MSAEKPKIGIFGSAVEAEEGTAHLARELGSVLGQYDLILISGAGGGVPSLVTVEAHKGKRVEIWGYSAARNLEEHQQLTPEDDPTKYTSLIYLPNESSYEGMHYDDVNVRRKLRNVVSTDACDAGIIVSGRFGTLNEFTNLFDMGKVIGVLTGSDGVADVLPQLLWKISKPSSAEVILENSPEKLVEKVLAGVKKRRERDLPAKT